MAKSGLAGRAALRLGAGPRSEEPAVRNPETAFRSEALPGLAALCCREAGSCVSGFVCRSGNQTRHRRQKACVFHRFRSKRPEKLTDGGLCWSGTMCRRSDCPGRPPAGNPRDCSGNPDRTAIRLVGSQKSKPPSFLQLAARADVERLLKSRAAGQMTCSQARFERNRIGIAPKSRESPTSSCVEAEEEASSGC